MRIMLKKLTKVLKNVQTEIQIEINNLFKTTTKKIAYAFRLSFIFLNHLLHCKETKLLQCT